MVPPGDIGPVPIWAGVYLFLALTGAISSYLFYFRVVRLIRQGGNVARFDHPWQRLTGAASIVLGQRKVLQRVPSKDWAGLAHALIFWGFLSFSLSYVIFIFIGSAWRSFPEKLLTGTGVRVFSSFLDVLAALLLVLLAWALLRRWVAKPRRLSFDLTRSMDSVVIVGLIAVLMISTLLTHAFFVAKGGIGPEAEIFIGGALGGWFTSLGISQGTATVFHGVFWWIHLGIILGFSVYISVLQAHAYGGRAPECLLSFVGNPGARWPPSTWENAQRFGAGRVQDFTWKQLLDGFACAVCGRCTDVCPAQPDGKDPVTHAHRGKT